MNFDADMVRDETDDALAIGGGQQLAGVADAFAQPIEPQPPVRIQHHLDNGRSSSQVEIDGPTRLRLSW